VFIKNNVYLNRIFLDHRCTVVETPGRWVVSFFCKHSFEKVLRVEKKSRGASDFTALLSTKDFLKVLLGGYMRCPLPSLCASMF
jgi:hypothetical protein